MGYLNTTARVVAFLVAVSLLVPLLVGLAAELPTRRARSRTRRHGGYIKPRASAPAKDGGQPQQATATTARISSTSHRGPVSADAVAPPTQARPNRPIARSFSTAETATHGDTHGRTVPGCADSPNPNEDHV